MHRLVAKSFVASSPSLLMLAGLIRQSSINGFRISPVRWKIHRRHYCRSLEFSNQAPKITRRLSKLSTLCEEADHSHIRWWREKLKIFKKPSSLQLVKRLVYTNLLGLDVTLKNGSLKEGTLNSEILQFKAKFPREVLLCRDKTLAGTTSYMELMGLSPYWFDSSQGNAIQNNVKMQSIFLLTGPNGGGKSSLLRSLCAAALLGICGLMVPAKSAIIPQFDAVMLHMKPYDSPADGKSSFQIEMSEVRSIVTAATKRTLVLVDEICRGTETAKGTCIAGSIIEKLDDIGCMGIISTHLHGIFDLPLSTKNVIFKQMGIEIVNGHIKPTWKLSDGICRESLAFETAQREGLPESVVRRAEELYLSTELRSGSVAPQLKSQLDVKESVQEFDSLKTDGKSTISGPMKELQREVESTLTIICQRKLIELYKEKCTSELSEVVCFKIGAREQPPPSTVGSSCVYVLFRPDSKLYIGQTDDLLGRVRSHRAKPCMQNAEFLYISVPGKSIASQLETLLINQLPLHGFRVTNVADGKHRHFGTSNFSQSSYFASQN